MLSTASIEFISDCGISTCTWKPMPVVGSRCHELRVRDVEADWSIVYRADSDAVVILAVFSKKTRTTPQAVIDTCIRRLTEYERA